MPKREPLTDHPALLAEWDYDLNEISPAELTSGSGKKCWWKCKEGHSWEAVVGDRVQKGSGCHFCSGQRVLPENSIASTHEALLAEWDYSKNEKPPQDYSAGSSRKVWWKCAKGHSWDTAVINRTKKQTGCPYCSNYYASEDNSIRNLLPHLLAEWHPTKNDPLTPDSVVAGSAKRIWWRCERGHEWRAAAASRKSGTGCPFCTNQSSRGEMRILAELSYFFDDLISRKKFSGHEVDIFVPSLNVGIEFDGRYYHRNSIAKDTKKNAALTKKGITLIRVREPGLEKIGDCDLILDSKEPSKQEIDRLFEMLSSFGELMGLSDYKGKEGFVNQELFQIYIDAFPNPLPGSSINETHPESNEYWDFEKNFPLTPKNFSSGSDFKAWWRCSKGHQTKAAVHSKLKKLSACLVCSKKSSDHFDFEDSVAHNFPEIANQWHPEKNGELTPDRISKGSTKVVWLVCQFGHEWNGPMYAYSAKKGCVECRSLAHCFPEILKFWDYEANAMQPEKIGRQSAKSVAWRCEKGHRFYRIVNVATKKDGLRCPVCRSLSVAKPHLLKEWDYEKNAGLLPSEVTIGSKRKVWWVCPQGHSYQASVAHRTAVRPTGCPKCYFKD